MAFWEFLETAGGLSAHTHSRKQGPADRGEHPAVRFYRRLDRIAIACHLFSGMVLR
jgi:hypothetical protein